MKDHKYTKATCLCGWEGCLYCDAIEGKEGLFHCPKCGHIVECPLRVVEGPLRVEFPFVKYE